jgi:replicative DNA helicase
MEDEAILKRVLPHSVEAERSVIGSILLDKEAASAAAEILAKDDFYTTSYGLMYECMADLYSEGAPIDVVTVQNRLKEKDVPPEVYSLDNFKDIMGTVPSAANIKSYATIVHEKAVLRRLIRVNEDIANSCYAGREPVADILQKTERDIFNVLQTGGSRELVPISRVTEDVLAKIDAASQTKEIVTGIPTGFIDLDNRTTGFQPSDFVLIAARPSMGKTAFVLNVLNTVAIKKKRPCIMFSLEMSREQLVMRMLSSQSGVDAQKLRTGNLNEMEWDELVRGAVQVSGSNLEIDDTPGINVSEMRSRCRKMKLEKGLDLIVIDYLQLMSSSGRTDASRQQEISDISRNLKSLAREMQCPVIALSQLSRAPEQRTDHRPMLSDLRESGAIEQDADVVMFLYRDEYYNKDTEHPGEAEVIIAKQRNGPIGTVTLLWKAETTRFVNIAR